MGDADPELDAAVRLVREERGLLSDESEVPLSELVSPPCRSSDWNSERTELSSEPESPESVPEPETSAEFPSSSASSDS